LSFAHKSDRCRIALDLHSWTRRSAAKTAAIYCGLFVVLFLIIIKKGIFAFKEEKQ